jgi:hypothetical protein
VKGLGAIVDVATRTVPAESSVPLSSRSAVEQDIRVVAVGIVVVVLHIAATIILTAVGLQRIATVEEHPVAVRTAKKCVTAIP